MHRLVKSVAVKGGGGGEGYIKRVKNMKVVFFNSDLFINFNKPLTAYRFMDLHIYIEQE